MINYTFSSEGFERTDKLQKYVEKKVKDLEKYIPRKARQSAILTVRITKSPRLKAEMYDCRVTLTLPEQVLTSGEKVEHAYAALDIAMAEIKTQVADYKSKYQIDSIRRRAVRRIQGLGFRNRDEAMMIDEAMAAAEDIKVSQKDKARSGANKAVKKAAKK